MRNSVGQYMKDQWAKGEPFRNQLVEINASATDQLQQALVNLIQEKSVSGKPNVHMNSMRSDIARFADSDEARKILQFVPGLGAAAGTAAGSQILFGGDGDDSWADTGMDLLGMGGAAGLTAYGVNRGPNSVGGSTTQGSMLSGMSPAKKLAVLAGAIGGKAGMDFIQGD